MQRLETLFWLVVLVLIHTTVRAQTSSACNPLTSGGCPPNPALAGTAAIDLAKGPPDQFTSQGNPTYDSNGASFTVAKSGDAPLISSNFYIMFGRLDVTMKGAKGAGIVSSVVMQSDVLDEIDWEWLGANPTEVQTNYFGKGQTTTYNRGQWHPNPGNQDTFKTYTIDWTANQIVWQIDGNNVRVQREQDAQGQYPQTPMQIKIGAWSGGDAATNAQGTIDWSRGPTDYSQGPFTMQVKSVTVTDYSTGTQYTYNGQDGTWKSIVAVGGQVNPSGPGNAGSKVAVVQGPAVTSMSPAMPAPFGAPGWAGNPSTLQSGRPVPTTYPGLPSGWTVTSSGKVLPPSSAPQPIDPTSPSSPSSPDSPGPVVAAGGAEVRTGFDDRGFPTVMTVKPGASAAPRYNEQGFLVTDTPESARSGAVAQAAAGKKAQEQGGPSNGAAANFIPNRCLGRLLTGILSGILML